MHKLLLILILLPLTLSAQTPDWVTNNGKSANYPPAEYITGFGVALLTPDGNNQAVINQAKEAARLDLVQRIKVTISATLSSGKNETDNSLHSYFGTVVQAVSNIEIQGLKIEQYWDNKAKTAYALAVANRETAVNSYQTKATTLRAKIKNNITQAEKNATAGRKNEALDYYLSCNALFREIEEITAILTVVGENRLQWNGIRSGVTDDLLVQEQVMKAIADLLSAPVTSLESAATYLTHCLAKQLKDREISVMVIPFSYRESKMGSAFSLQLAQLIEVRGSASARWSVVQPSAENIPAQDNLVRGFVPQAEFVLAGSYWDTPDGIKVIATLSRAGKGEVVGGTEFLIPAGAHNLPIKPENYQTAIRDQQLFRQEEMNSQGLTAQVWTNRGADNVLYTAGDTMTVFVRVNMPCNIRLIYHLANGARAVLLDSMYIDMSKVNRVVAIPTLFECAPPYGAEVLQLLASTTPFEPLQTKMVDGNRVIAQDLQAFLKGGKGMRIIAQDNRSLQAEARLVLTTMP